MQESLDLAELFYLLLKKLWLIALLSVIGLLVAFGYTKIFLTPLYTSSATLYVSNAVMNEPQDRINYSDITASQQLVNTYGVIIESNSVLEDVIASVNISLNTTQLKDMITVKAKEETAVMEVYVTSDNPQKSADIANAIARVAPGRIKEITKAGAVELVDKALPNPIRSSPHTGRNCLIGILLGFFAAVLYVILHEMLDNHVKGEEDVRKHYNLPILGSIPVLKSQPKGGYYYEK